MNTSDKLDKKQVRLRYVDCIDNAVMNYEISENIYNCSYRRHSKTFDIRMGICKAIYYKEKSEIV